MLNNADVNIQISSQTLVQNKKIWKNLHEGVECGVKLRPIIEDSWERSKQCGVNPYVRECKQIISKKDFEQAVQHSDFFVSCAVPIMVDLLEYFRGTGFVCGITDASGVTLKTIGDSEALAWAKRANLSEGVVWTEKEIGTNGASLCMTLMRPVTVCSYEHYSLFGVVCASCFCPIVDEGSLIGSVGLVAPYECLTVHTLGMVEEAAMHIQSVMHLRRILRHQEIVMNSISDGLLAVDGRERITLFNKKCADLLEIRPEDAIGKKLVDVLGDGKENQYFFNLIAHNLPITDEYVMLNTGAKKIRCNMTCAPVHKEGKSMGTVVLMHEYERVNQIVGKWMGRNAKLTFSEIIGQDPAFLSVIKDARSASASPSNVLLLGESGTGKDVIAQAMHNESYRRKSPFVAVNCAALPRDLIASELFGYEEGAFTGAKKGGNTGKFELADHGTLFLDEIGDLPIDLQATLLRVLEEKGIQRLGGNKFIPIDVRIIAATNRNLPEEIEKNRFRRDLYYRLGVIKLRIPPLRDRKGDVELLANHFLSRICARFGKPEMHFSQDALDLLVRSEWPGNVRELQNVLECVVQLSSGPEIGANELANQIHLPVEDDINRYCLSVEPQSVEFSEGKDMHDKIEELLRTRMTKQQMANKLGISKRTLYRYIKKFDLSL